MAMTDPQAARRIALVRHGSTAWNVPGRLTSHTDLELSPAGEDEARLLARRLRDELPAAQLWASPALRARQTAAEIGALLKTDCRIVDDAREAGFGRFEGLTRAELTGGAESGAYARWEAGLEVGDAEPLADVGTRAARVFSAMLTSTDAIDQILVTHGVFIRVLLCVAVLGLEPTAYRRLVVDNASITVVRADQDGLRLSLLNSCEHLRLAEAP